MNPRPRFIVCMLIGFLATDWVRWVALTTAVHRDFGQVWYAATATLHGRDPYALIGPGLAFEWPAPLFYPLPAALVALPVAPLPYPWAMAVFAGLSAFALAWALTEHGYAPLLAFPSACVMHALYIAQWSPLLAGAVVLAPLGVLLIAKPTIGLAVFAARPSWWAVWGAVGLTLLAFLLQPQWVTAWRAALHAASVGAGAKFPYSAPVTLPGGPIVLLGLLRWRRPEARLLVVLACVPQTLLPYEGVLLFLIPRGWWQCLTFTGLSYAMVRWVRTGLLDLDLAQLIAIYGPAMVMFLYVPATVLVLARPNAGTVPEWMEQRLARAPAWLRGVPA